MDVLMIGGTRFMGRMAVRKLLDQGDRVTIFSRGNVKPDWWDEVEHIQGDRFETEDFAAKLKGKRFDAVIDSQAFGHLDVKNAITAMQGNVGRYLFVSSGAVYGTQDDWPGKIDWFAKSPFKETDVSWDSLDYDNPVDEFSYAAGKRRGEKWLQESSPTPYTIVRIPAMLGEDDNEERPWWWTQRAMDGGPILMPAENRGMFRCLYAADAADAYVKAIKSPRAENQTYHVAAHEIIAIEHFAELVCRTVGHESTLTLVPWESILRHDGLRQNRRWYSRLARPFPYIPDLSKADEEIGFTTTPLETWVRSTVEWYMNQYQGEDSAGYEFREAEIALAASGRTYHFIRNTDFGPTWPPR